MHRVKQGEKMKSPKQNTGKWKTNYVLNQAVLVTKND
jgi:hypothetical protein